MTQPVESVNWINTMTTKLSIQVKVDVAKVITALAGLCLAIAHIAGYV